VSLRTVYPVSPLSLSHMETVLRSILLRSWQLTWPCATGWGLGSSKVKEFDLNILLNYNIYILNPVKLEVGPQGNQRPESLERLPCIYLKYLNHVLMWALPKTLLERFLQKYRSFRPRGRSKFWVDSLTT
jgi:hypothetical protein